MRIAALISGGKDSIYAAYKLSKKYKLVCLISFKSLREDSYMFHIPNIDLTKLQAKSMGLPIIFEESSGIKEKELEDIKKALKEYSPDYFLWLNDDIEFIEEDWLKKMVDVGESDEKIGILGCKLIYPNGNLQWFFKNGGMHLAKTKKEIPFSRD